MSVTIAFFARMFLLSALLLFASPGAAGARVNPEEASILPAALEMSAGKGACGAKQAELLAYRDRIAGAPSPEKARALALDQTRIARKALSRARWIIPFHPALKEGRAKLEEFEERVREAKTQAEVAHRFGRLVRAASADDLKIVDADFKADCEYTSGEIVIIVIGFLLAIIPGFIFMALLC